MGTLIDSSVLIAAESRALDLPALVVPGPDDPVAIAAISASELLHGIQRAATPVQRRRESLVERLLAVLPVLPCDLVTARTHASLWASLASKGTSVGAHDLLIGATAIATGYRVATRDRRSFPKIPGLEIVLV